MVLLKLDFRKAYDSVSWDFLFEAMNQMDMPHRFVQMVRLLFGDAESAVVVNGELSDPFPIQRGMR
jgi:hypothetical protein